MTDSISTSDKPKTSAGIVIDCLDLLFVIMAISSKVFILAIVLKISLQREDAKSRIYGLLSKTPIVTTFHSGEKPIGRFGQFGALGIIPNTTT
ncbi:hypothetical protein B0B39_19090 (plasmid) [Legionella longbeachae]|uniref:hypothetical protein n=1 Tax=Legionella longbeachae TaxID=450 RepID=UPI000A1C062A|nr:hypothetical protein [Legionella longbeachae]QED10781.1 hypothetical protein B0B39_19090 [Legionella longbeachae]